MDRVAGTAKVLRDLRGRTTRDPDLKRLSRALEQSEPLDVENDAAIPRHDEGLLFRCREFRSRHGSRRPVDPLQADGNGACAAPLAAPGPSSFTSLKSRDRKRSPV